MPTLGGFYDFTSNLASKDTAYTSIALDAHTDTTYFSDPAGLQMFHLLSHSEGDGGQSLLVDGHEIAAILELGDSNAFCVLQYVPVEWHASGNEGISISPSIGDAPVIRAPPRDEVWSPFGPSMITPVDQIRWNNSDRATSDLSLHLEDMEPMDWYEAARKWVQLVRTPSLEYKFQLEPGRPLSRWPSR